MHWKCVLKHVTEGKEEGNTEETGRRGRRRKELLDGLKEKREYWKLKEGILDRKLWSVHFGGGCGTGLRQTTRGMIYSGLFTAHTEHRVIIVTVIIYISVDKKSQLDVTFCILYFSSNSCSTCFGQPCAYHQELTTAWCYGLVLVCVVAAGRLSSPVGS